MGIKERISKEKIVEGVKRLGKLRMKVNHETLLSLSALLLIISIAFTIRILPLRWEIEVGSLHLSEFDPYFQYRIAEHMVNHGFLSWGWVDKQRWYPAGINVTKTGYPGVGGTAAALYELISLLGVHVQLMDFCALFPALMGTLACILIYFLGKDIGGKPVGLLASLFLALNAPYIQRTCLGFFDDETIGIVSLILFAFLFLRAIEEERPLNSTIKYALASGLVLGYFCSGWGAAYYPIDVTVLFVLILILLKRYSQKLLVTYSITFGLGLFLAIQVPKLGLSYLTSSVILPVAGVFILLCLCEAFRNIISTKWKIVTVIVFLALLIGIFAGLWQLGYMRGLGGKFLSVINPFARGVSPLIESVAEHRISAWSSIYYSLGISIVFFILGFFFAIGNLNNKNLYLVILGLTSLYFACSMVRLLVLMAPAFSLLAAIGVMGVLRPFGILLSKEPKITTKKKYGVGYVGKEFSGAAVFLVFLVLMTNFAFPMQTATVYQQVDTPVTITAASLPIAPNEPVREWYDMVTWVNNNLESTTVVCSWWDYGYWLTVLGNVTTLADNATVNRTQIENIGFVFMANETQALQMLKLYNVSYVLVFVTIDTQGRWVDWGGGDNGKWIWMASISGKAHDRFIQKGFIDASDMWTSDQNQVRQMFGNYSLGVSWYDKNHDGQTQSDELIPVAKGLNSTIYKLMNYAVNSWRMKWNVQGSQTQPVKLKYFDEAYIAGLDLDPNSQRARNYGNLVPLVCLYKVNWQAFYHDHPEQRS